MCSFLEFSIIQSSQLSSLVQIVDMMMALMWMAHLQQIPTECKILARHQSSVFFSIECWWWFYILSWWVMGTNCDGLVYDASLIHGKLSKSLNNVECLMISLLQSCILIIFPEKYNLLPYCSFRLPQPYKYWFLLEELKLFVINASEISSRSIWG